ncbi:MAG: glucosaminidase domain-containing protein [Myxococcota bacterium]|nr:glucosaminidase domain-containing protein [Myxococcota bacterium]
MLTFISLSHLVFAQDILDLRQRIGLAAQKESRDYALVEDEILQATHYAVDPCIDVDQVWSCFWTAQNEVEQEVSAQTIVLHEASGWPNDYRGEFLWSIAPAALISAKKNGIYPSVVLAQAILESGWGTSNLTVNHNNLFGVKAPRGKNSVEITTIESVNGKKVYQKATFRRFTSWDDSIAYHGRLLGGSHYYAFAKPIARSGAHYLELIAPRYASQPGYAKYVQAILAEYNLDMWDEHFAPPKDD